MHPLLKKEAFKNTYKHKLYPVSRTLNKHKLYPIPNESKWLSFLHDNMSIVVKAHGRPQTKRKREVGEGKTFQRSSSLKCSNCDEWGHNVITCKALKRSKLVNKLDLSYNQVTYLNFSAIFNK